MQLLSKGYDDLKKKFKFDPPYYIVHTFVKNNLKIQLTASDLCTVHKFRKKKLIAQGPDRRQIIAKLCCRSIKKNIIFVSKNQVTDAARLTPARSTIMYALHQIRTNLVVSCSSFDRKIYAHTKDPNALDVRKHRQHLVNTHAVLEELCNEYVKKLLEEFLTSQNH